MIFVAGRHFCFETWFDLKPCIWPSVGVRVLCGNVVVCSDAVQVYRQDRWMEVKMQPALHLFWQALCHTFDNVPPLDFSAHVHNKS